MTVTATSTGGKCLVNVYAKSRLILEPLPPPIRNQGSGRSLPGPDAGHPLHGAVGLLPDGPRRGDSNGDSNSNDQ
jgi:hypothetical protein